MFSRILRNAASKAKSAARPAFRAASSRAMSTMAVATKRSVFGGALGSVCVLAAATAAATNRAKADEKDGKNIPLAGIPVRTHFVLLLLPPTLSPVFDTHTQTSAGVGLN
jgi:hypothetical protein